MTSAFNTEFVASSLAQIGQDDESKFIDTWNGAKEFRSMGSTFLAKLVELEEIANTPKRHHEANGHGVLLHCFI